MPSQEIKRARTTSLILGLAATLSVVIFVYALQQKSRADQLQTEVDSLKRQMEMVNASGDSARVK
jgi:preprotein translocase subunit YajC